MAATAPLREALNQGISSGSLVDTKIVLYSRRDSSGRVCRPKALYANSHVLKTVPYFNDLLFGDFVESRSKDFEEVADEEEYGEDYGYFSDSDLEDEDDDEKVPVSKRATRVKASRSDPLVISGEDRAAYEDHEERVEKGKVVKVSDMAFVTFQAFLMYLYTDVIEFAPFGSEENRRSRSAEIVDSSDDKIPRPSPKSIYRLADKYDVPALKTLALCHIRSRLSECDIVEEAFSRFASRYEEIRNMYIKQLAFTWLDDSATEAIRAGVDEKIESFAEGGLEHASDVLLALLEIANRDGDVKPPANTSSAFQTPRVTSPAHWTSVKTALIKSVRQGVFFDKKYWARHSRTGHVLKPIYFSSTVMNDKVQQLGRLVKYVKGRNHVVGDPDRDAGIESDCEGDSLGVVNESLKGEETRAVLTTGSFSAWKSLFFYRCTDSILFAPLRSQGIDSRSDYIRRRTVSTAPPPCSPKSIYTLATLLGIQPLCNSAFTDIRTKVTVDNVVGEIFSWIAMGQEKIVEMQWELLIANYKDPKTVALVKEHVGYVSSGSSSHCAGTLKLGLKKAFELKKKKRQPRGGAELRCSNYNCTWHDCHISYSSIASATYSCQTCICRGWGSHYLQCAGCGTDRTSNYTSCQGCGKRFM